MKQVPEKKTIIIWTSSLLLRNYLKRIFADRGALVKVIKNESELEGLSCNLLVVDEVIAEKISSTPELSPFRKKPVLIISSGGLSLECVKTFLKAEVVKKTVSESEIVHRAEMLLGISHRKRVKMLVKGERGEGEMLLFWIMDISVTGCRIRTDVDLATGERIKLFLSSPDAKVENLEGEIVRKLEARDERGRPVKEYGIKFLTPSATLENFLKTFMHR